MVLSAAACLSHVFIAGAPSLEMIEAPMKKRIRVEDRPPLEGERLLVFVLPLAIALLAGITLSVIVW
jgi:hypothetical protein